MSSVQILRIVVASPGDVQAERDALATVVEELNRDRGIAADRGLRLELVRWETDAYPGFHPAGPQGLIDCILKIENCDVLIGIFWKRFGTPVNDAQSGTEHEILKAYAAWQAQNRPQIMVYFNQKSYKLKSKAETDQCGQVLEFHKRFPKEGLWWPYKGTLQFERLVRRHLRDFIRNKVIKHPDGHPAIDSFVNGVIERGLSQCLRDIGLSEYAVDWLDKEAKVPPLFGRLIIKTLALLADKSGKAAGEHLLKFISEHLLFYKNAEQKLNDLLTYIDGELRAKEEVRAVIAGQRSAKVGTELANNLPLALQAAIKPICDVEKLSDKVGDLVAKDKIKDLSRSIESGMSKIKELLNPQPALQINVFEEDATGLNRFVYGTQKTPFLGRKEEIEKLEEFLADERSFCWGIVTGEGGLGKSRLALELCLRNGNVWRAGFIPPSCSADDYKNWVPNQPTLIIADYAASRAKDIGDIVRMMKTHADCGEVPYPVRLLLLERNKKSYYKGKAYYTDVREEQWFKSFLGAGWVDQEAAISVWYAKASDPMTLGALDSEDTWKIICTFGKEKAIEDGRDQILGKLKEIDSLCRPLYAAILGDAIGAGRHYRQLGTIEVFRDILERERQKFWAPAGVTQEDQEVLALVTMAGDIDMQSVFLPKEIEEMISDERFSPERYPLMAAGSTNTVLRPLEPDIVGEAFVLEFLRPDDLPPERPPTSKESTVRIAEEAMSGNDDDLDLVGDDFGGQRRVLRSRRTKRVDKITHMAWSLNAAKMRSFLWRVANDFPTHPTLPYLERLPGAYHNER